MEYINASFFTYSGLSWKHEEKRTVEEVENILENEIKPSIMEETIKLHSEFPTIFRNH